MYLRKDLLSASIFVSGCIFDHVTTAYGVSIPGLTESNSFVLILMGYGLWHFAEFFIIFFGLIAVLMAKKFDKSGIVTFSAVMLSFSGILRLLFGFQNLTIILNALL